MINQELVYSWIVLWSRVTTCRDAFTAATLWEQKERREDEIYSVDKETQLAVSEMSRGYYLYYKTKDHSPRTCVPKYEKKELN
jgi:hypothetical protein